MYYNPFFWIRQCLISMWAVLMISLLFTPFTVTWSKSIPNHLRWWDFALYVSGFCHIHGKTPRGILPVNSNMISNIKRSWSDLISSQLIHDIIFLLDISAPCFWSDPMKNRDFWNVSRKNRRQHCHRQKQMYFLNL